MREIEIARSMCPVCGAGESAPLFDAGDWAFGMTDRVFEVRRCRTCSAGYVAPRPSSDELADYYPSHYYWSYERAGGTLDWDAIIAARATQLQQKARILAGLPQGRLLDIGAQKGEFIWYMRRRGWDAEGVELDNAVPNPQGLPIHYGDVLSMDLEPASYDVVTAWAVLEHVLDPRQIVQRVTTLLRPGGRFVALVTNLNSIQARWFRADDYPRHLTLFTRRSVRRLAGASGLDVERIWTDQRIFGGALNGGLVFLAKRLGGYTAEEAFREWKDLRDPLLFYGKWRQRPSAGILNLSRLDRALTWLPEKILDSLGFGFNMTFVASRPMSPQRTRRRSWCPWPALPLGR